MTDKQLLLSDIDKLHTTELGVTRIKRNLGIDVLDIVEYCKNIIADDKTAVYKNGKNFYCEALTEIITVNRYSFTIITAHKKKK